MTATVKNSSSACRRANIDCLRVFLMVLVILHHYSVHTPWPFSSNAVLSRDTLIVLLGAGGKVANDGFFLISGYLGIRSRFKSKSVLRIVLQTLFYSWIFLCIFGFATSWQGPAGYPFTFENVQRAVFPCTGKMYGFVTDFIMVMIASPFLRLIYGQLRETQRSFVGITGFLFFSVLPAIFLRNEYLWYGIWYCYVYFLGGCIRDAEERVARGLYPGGMRSKRFDFIGCVFRHSLGVTICGLLFGFVTVVGIKFLNLRGRMSFLSCDYFVMRDWTPSTFLISIGLTCVFLKIRITKMGSIWSLAGQSVFGIYLLHDNPVFRLWCWPHFSVFYGFGIPGILAGGTFAVALFIMQEIGRAHV